MNSKDMTDTVEDNTSKGNSSPIIKIKNTKRNKSKTLVEKPAERVESIVPDLDTKSKFYIDCMILK